MTNYTKVFAASTAMILTTCAMADLRYGQAILSAESNCFVGSQHQLVEQTLAVDSSLEANTSCGGGMTSAVAETGEDYFVLSAGSTLPGSNSSSDDEASVIVDGGNGHASVEFQIKIDRPTLFTMSRSIARSHVSFWDGVDLLDTLEFSGDETALREGHYWVSIETDDYGTPVWAEVEWWQAADEEPGDLDKDGKVDQKDVAILVSLMTKSPKDASKESKSDHATGGTCTSKSTSSDKSGSKVEIAKPSNDKPQFEDKPSQNSGGSKVEIAKPSNDKPQFEDKPAQNSGGSKVEIAKPSNDKPQFEDKPAQNSGGSKAEIAKPSNDKSSKGKASFDAKGSNPHGTPLPRPKPGSFSSDKVKGDLNNDKKVDMKDLFILLGRL